MATIDVIYGDQSKQISAAAGTLLSDVILESGFPFEQPCAGKGTCGKCKVICEAGLAPPDEIELQGLSEGERALGSRLACRALVESDADVILTPVVVYSNKAFKHSRRYRTERDALLGLAVDLGTTTAAAYITTLADGEVNAGAAALNQQTVFGADVISRLFAASHTAENKLRLQKLAIASINQAVDALKLPGSVKERIAKISIVCNPAMHHLLTGLDISTLMLSPFRPSRLEAIRGGVEIIDRILPKAEVWLAPLIGGFVGSDALACLAYFKFAKQGVPLAAIDLGTNGEVMVTDGQKILTASTAAGPAFEGVNIRNGSRAVDGAITGGWVEDGELQFETINDAAPVGITGSGLIRLVDLFRQISLILPSGKINTNSAYFQRWGGEDGRRKLIWLDRERDIQLTQIDIRELQKAKGAIRAAMDILISELDLKPEDLERIYLTGSFGGVVDIDAVLRIGMIPDAGLGKVETIANAAGLGAAMFLSENGERLAEKITRLSEQVDLDQNAQFQQTYINAMGL